MPGAGAAAEAEHGPRSRWRGRTGARTPRRPVRKKGDQINEASVMNPAGLDRGANEREESEISRGGKTDDTTKIEHGIRPFYI